MKFLVSMMLATMTILLSGCTFNSCRNTCSTPNYYNDACCEIKPRCCPQPHNWCRSCCDPSNYEYN